VTQFVGFMGAHLPALETLDPAALLLTLAAIVAIFRFRVGALKVLVACAAAGLLWGLATGAT
jgi:chromate transporter